MTEKHTLRSFDDALESLSLQVHTLGQQVAQIMDTAGAVFRERDVERAKGLVREDLQIDRQHDAINSAVVDVLSRFQAVARDLREVLAMEHATANLEQIADHAKSIAKRSITASTSEVTGDAAEILNTLHGDVVRTLREVMRAMADRDASLANQICRHDEQLDQLYDDLFHTVIAQLQTSRDTVHGDVHILFVGKSLERIGDHATNIAEEIRFMTKGDLPSATREV